MCTTFSSFTSHWFLEECVPTAICLINDMLTPILSRKSPFEILFGKSPNYSYLQVFGSLCYAHNRTKDKFDKRSRKCIFVGYPFGKKGWRVYDLDSHKIFMLRVVKFCESVFTYSAKAKQPNEALPLFADHSPVIPTAGPTFIKPVLLQGEISHGPNNTQAATFESQFATSTFGLGSQLTSGPIPQTSKLVDIPADPAGPLDQPTSNPSHTRWSSIWSIIRTSPGKEISTCYMTSSWSSQLCLPHDSTTPPSSIHVLHWTPQVYPIPLSNISLIKVPLRIIYPI